MMSQKKFFVPIIIVIALITLYFIIKGKLDIAILTMMALFSLTNASRAKSFKEQGYERESKWMRYLSITFGAAFVVVFALIFFM
ncbi:hypothetical protein ACFQ38_00665 [Sporosarcina contaminans]|uniref:Aspartyl/asparaginyl-tRNA synthetase n=2 Tax=Caryophanaceae TaxID=186818 RepID=A0ABW3TTE5_9BACL